MQLARKDLGHQPGDQDGVGQLRRHPDVQARLQRLRRRHRHRHHRLRRRSRLQDGSTLEGDVIVVSFVALKKISYSNYGKSLKSKKPKDSE